MSDLVHEAIVLRQFNHPNVVRLLDVIEVDNCEALVLQYFQGGDLEQSLSRRSVSHSERLIFLRSAFSGLQYIHEQGWIHGDVKPANLVVGDNGQIAWCDFGSAVKISHSKPCIRESVGYLAPEIASESNAASVQSDIYALGVSVYEILSENRAFPNATLASHATNAGPLLPTFRAKGIPRQAAWQAILRKATNPNSGLRYQSVADFWEDIRRVSNRLPISAKKESSLHYLMMWCYREKLLATMFGVVVASLLFLTLAGSWAWSYVEDSRKAADDWQIALSLEIQKSKVLQKEVAINADNARLQGQKASEEERFVTEDSSNLSIAQDALKRNIVDANALLDENNRLVAKRNDLFLNFNDERLKSQKSFQEFVHQLQVEYAYLPSSREDINPKNIGTEWIYFKPDSSRLVAVYKGVDFELRGLHSTSLDIDPDNALSSIFVTSKIPDASLAELRMSWDEESLSFRKIGKRPLITQRVQFGRVYETEPSNSRKPLRFRVVGFNRQKFVASPDDIRSIFIKVKLDPERISILQNENDEWDIHVLNTKVSWDGMQTIQSVGARVHYEQVEFVVGERSSKVRSKARALKITNCSFPNSTGTESKHHFSLGDQPNLARLTLEGSSSIPETIFGVTGSLPNLRFVSLVRTPVSIALAKEIAELPALSSLELVETNSSLAELQEISKSPKLDSLVLISQPKLNADIYKPLSDMPALLELVACDLPLYEGDSRSLSLMRNLASLKIYDNGDGRMTIQDQHIEGVEQLTQLCCLDLRSRGITDLTLERLQKCVGLRLLTSSKSSFSQVWVQKLLDANPGLRIEQDNTPIRNVLDKPAETKNTSPPKVSKSPTVPRQQKAPGHFQEYSFRVFEKAKATVDYQGNDAQISIQEVGDLKWHIQFYSKDFQLIEGQQYRARFVAASPTKNRVLFDATQASGDFQNVGLNETIDLVKEFKTYEFLFTAKGLKNLKNRVGVQLGWSKGDIQIRSITLELMPSPEKIVESISYGGGIFYHMSQPDQWIEAKKDSPLCFFFREQGRDDKYISIHDATRNYTIRLPIQGGKATISIDGEKTWVSFPETEKLSKGPASPLVPSSPNP